jgi:carbon-monoxide dehydrogenase small subunit
MLMAGEAFLASGSDPSEEAVREAIAGNLCRCTGYTKIIDAILLAAERRTAADETGPRDTPT